MKEHDEFGQAAAAVLRDGNALYPTPTATTVRGQGGDPPPAPALAWSRSITAT